MSSGRSGRMSPGTECWKSCENRAVENMMPAPDSLGAHEAPAAAAAAAVVVALSPATPATTVPKLSGRVSASTAPRIISPREIKRAAAIAAWNVTCLHITETHRRQARVRGALESGAKSPRSLDAMRRRWRARGCVAASHHLLGDLKARERDHHGPKRRGEEERGAVGRRRRALRLARYC